MWPLNELWEWLPWTQDTSVDWPNAAVKCDDAIVEMYNLEKNSPAEDFLTECGALDTYKSEFIKDSKELGSVVNRRGRRKSI